MFITANNVSFSYTEDKQVLKNVSLSLEKGKTLAIVGASGCGKSTLLKILSGILPNDAGDISIRGMTPDDYRKTGRLSFMFQEPTLLPNLNVRDNVAFPLKIKGETNFEAVDDLIGTVGLKEFANYLPKNLSGGMKTRVALSRSFVSEPELLFLDEPFAALDIAWKSKLYLELENFVDRFGTTVMFVTHDVQEALLLSNHVIVLGHGGNIIRNMEHTPNNSISSRVKNISNFVASDQFRTNYVEIQELIMTDGVRSFTGRAEVDRILQRIDQSQGIPWETLELDVKQIRPFSNDRKVHSLLLRAFRKSTSYKFRHEILWDILNFEKVDESTRREIRDFYLENLENASRDSLSFHRVVPNHLFDLLEQRSINGNEVEYPPHKRFVYLCDLYQSTERAKVLGLYDRVIRGEVPALEDDLSRETAAILREMIK